jgi:hypothetical protein
MSYQPPTAPNTSAPDTSEPVPTTATVPVPTAPVPSGPPAAENQPYAAGTFPSGMTSDGNVVTVRPWRASNYAVSTAAQALLLLTAIANLAIAVNDVLLDALLTERDYAAIVDRHSTVDGLSGVTNWLALLTVLVFLVWMHRFWTSDRSAHNVYTRGTGFAVGGWLIPVAGFILGPNALRDLWHGTENASKGVLDGPVDRSTPRLVSWWWVAWLAMAVSAVAGRVARAMAEGAPSLPDLLASLQSGLRIEIVSCVVSAVAAVLLVLVIRRITAFTRR